MNPPRLYGTVYLTPAGAARWPELGLLAGAAVMLIDAPGQFGQAAQIPFHPLGLLLADGDYTTTDRVPASPAQAAATQPPGPAAGPASLRPAPAAPNPAAPPANTAQEVTACRTSPTPRTPTPTGSDAPAPLTPVAPGWPGMTGLADDTVRWEGFGALGTLIVFFAVVLIVMWTVPW